MPQWRRTLYTLWVTQFITVVGYSFVEPFIAYFVQELGVTDVKEVALWAGLAMGLQSAAMALVAPVWGLLADRHGRKLMVIRAIYGTGLLLGALAFVVNVQQLIVLEVLQGALTGTVVATTALVASVVPRERVGMAVGSLQTAVFLGSTVGPMLGGLAGDAFGYRPGFLICGALLFISGTMVVFLVKEDFHPSASATQARRSGYGETFRFLRSAGGILLAVLIVRLLVRTGLQVLVPTVPLFVQSLLPEGAAVAATMGLVTGARTIGSALGSPFIGSWGDKFGHRQLLMGSALLAGLCYLPQTFAPHPAWLIFWQLLAGIAVGGTMSTLAALLVRSAPEGREGTVFGLDATVSAGAGALGPLLGAAIGGGFGLRVPFAVCATMFIAGGLVVFLKIPAESAAPVHGPVR